jgi:hypothetical protein
MTAETHLYATLTAASAVTALVSTRIYPDVAPQEVAVPCIAFSRTATEYIQTIHGPVVAQRVSLEISCMASTRSSAEQIADAVTVAATAARFIPVGRSADFDPDSGLWAAVLTADYWQT